ncbi:T9SS type A sorting domain-containing protein [Aureisphaera sp.]
MIKCIFFLLIGNIAIAQTVSTFMADPSIDVDDALVFDSDGNLYGSNFSGDTVYQIGTDGVATPFVSGFTNPNGLAFDTSGNLFVIDWGAGEIVKFDATGTLLETYVVGPTPSGLIASPSGTMLYTDTGDNSIKELATDGSITTLVTGAPLNAPVGLAYDETNTLYVGNFVGREIYRVVGSSLEYVATVPDGGAADNPFLGFIAYADGNLYGTTFGGHKIYKINPLLVDDVILFTGGEEGSMDGDISEASFSYPNGIVYNPSQQALYISEFSGVGNIRRIDDFVLGIEDIGNDLELSIAPNPVNHLLNVDVPDSVLLYQGTISIYSLSGTLLSKVQLGDTNSNALDVSWLSSGMYFVEVNSPNNGKAVTSFIKN